MDLQSWWVKILVFFIDAGIANGFLFALVFIKWRESHAQRLLAFIAILLSVIIFKIYYVTPYLFQVHRTPFLGSGPFTLLLAPALYLYFRSILVGDEKFALNDLLHVAPFLFYFILIFPRYLLIEGSAYTMLLQKVIGSPWIFLVIQMGYYLYQSRKLYHSHRLSLSQKYSSVEGLEMSWFNTFLKIFFVLLFFLMVITPTLLHGVGINGYYLFSSIFFTFIQVLIVYKGIPQQVVKSLNNIEPVAEIKKEEDASSLDLLKDELIAYMDTQKPYLQYDLTLVDLAGKLNVTRNQLSQVMNDNIGDNFYHFINTYRIEEVKRLMKEDSAKRYTVMGLANDAGFNSKSTFNQFFKKAMGMTPSEYRNGLK